MVWRQAGLYGASRLMQHTASTGPTLTSTAHRLPRVSKLPPAVHHSQMSAGAPVDQTLHAVHEPWVYARVLGGGSSSKALQVPQSITASACVGCSGVSGPGTTCRNWHAIPPLFCRVCKRSPLCDFRLPLFPLVLKCCCFIRLWRQHH